MNDSAVEANAAGVRFETRRGRNDLHIALAHLSRPRQLNALTAEMCEAMLARFAEWAANDSIACIVLDGDGDRGFCSGGDVVTAVRAIREGGERRHAAGDRLFAAEYRLVQAIFEYPKPVVAWMHGVTMGAGLGLATAASHRIASPGVRIAMPESRIGLFPDVGAAWFLGRAPANAGPLVALTGIVLDAADAVFLRLADWVVPEAERDAFYGDLASADLTGQSTEDASSIAKMIAALPSGRGTGDAAGNVLQRLDPISEIGQARTVRDLTVALTAAAERDPWFAGALSNLHAGSPTSIHVGFEHFRRSRGKSLRDVLNDDLVLAKAFVRGHDFPEGVRAALIDKDRRPVWNPAGCSPAELMNHAAKGRA